MPGRRTIPRICLATKEESMSERIDEETSQFPAFALITVIDGDALVPCRCPCDTCGGTFGVYMKNWIGSLKFGDLTCPDCGMQALAYHFLPEDWTRSIGERVAENCESFHLTKHTFVKEKAKDSFRMVSVSLDCPMDHNVKITCENCGLVFFIEGNAYFCPECGYCSADRMFETKIREIESNAGNIDRIKRQLRQLNPRHAEMTCKSMLETSLVECVMAFQQFCKASYFQHPDANPKASKLAFQRIRHGSCLWKRLLGEGYQDWLEREELRTFERLFQRRHLLSHNQGIVDEVYLRNSRDREYSPGRRIVVNSRDVLELTRLTHKIVKRIQRHPLMRRTRQAASLFSDMIHS